MNPLYKPRTPEQKLGYLVEECGEVLSAVGKTLRWGPDSFNPELPEEQQETNRDWVLRELKDLERAVGFARDVLDPERELTGGAERIEKCARNYVAHSTQRTWELLVEAIRAKDEP